MFEDGNTTIDITFPGAGTYRPVNLSIPRNTTVMEAAFNLEVNGSATDIGSMQVDIGEDGHLEWAFDDVGYGSLGVQRTFNTGGEYQMVNIMK